ncbi:DUF4892 domain-containing protein [Pseudomonas alcaligenes]|uniref:DUF4892 domain-containing protein n=1 Tax=Aquipseudomonas alcaligenes TaxID=43263 RepID=A0ABR7S1I6_AQUAC|nr:DUF4892 domain-containing protein [Pseudomonas alcaligenes]MBC9250577.1 DUF4892 domain-containing protein [Pseudomonas alcaligenes]
MRPSLFAALLLCTTPLLADDLPGSADLAVLPRFAHAEIVDYRDSASSERSYPQSEIRRISGQLQLERQVQAEGRLRALTYRLPDGHRPESALDTARHELLGNGAQLLYWCQGRECGSSNLWANALFGNAKLYGPDERQSFLLLRLAAPQQDSLLALYGITRGNRRVYLQVEQLDANQPLAAQLPTASTLLRQLRAEGELNLAALQAPQADWSDLLARTLSLDITLRVSLAGAQAEAWQAALLVQGVRATRVELGEGGDGGLQVRVLP